MRRGDTFQAAVNIFAKFLRRMSSELQISEFGELADLSETAFRTGHVICQDLVSFFETSVVTNTASNRKTQLRAQSRRSSESWENSIRTLPLDPQAPFVQPATAQFRRSNKHCLQNKENFQSENPPETSDGVSQQSTKALCTKQPVLFPAQLLSLVQPGQLANASCSPGDATKGWRQRASSASTGREASEPCTVCQLDFANRTRILLEQ